ncbi:hypothetical protein AWC38_SpisGene19593 [Stylophora pistillata]|uniref:Uncharacterized protein n=1 Tax=Stylophora pistillata TaxID=50429 RepID=A0A2B4RIF9_STYPI|nr:hypothetical protein AWC38_SpisGene19593 [Stylophora pistillata]
MEKLMKTSTSVLQIPTTAAMKTSFAKTPRDHSSALVNVDSPGIYTTAQTSTSVLQIPTTAAMKTSFAKTPRDHSSALVNVDSPGIYTTAQVPALLRSAHTRYIFPTQLIPIFRFFLKPKNLKSLMMSPKSHSSALKAVFTNLNASGRIGPTTLGSHYTGQDHDGQVTLSSGVQQWTVPYTGDYRIQAIAAAGGYDIRANSILYRGRGARMIGTFRLNKGEVIQILVGQEGGINTHSYSSGGGGGTFVVRGANTPLIIAGGGGGTQYAGSRLEGCYASTNTTGNPGYKSWSGGSNGHGAQTADDGWSGGGGGGFYSSGRSGTNFNGPKGLGGEGGKGFNQGGVGGRAKHFHVDGGFGGGGGGGGAYGWEARYYDVDGGFRGGGGAYRTIEGGGGGGGGYSGGGSGKGIPESCGGGGGSYNNGSNQDNECCFNNAGHGQVTITFLE